MKNIQIEMCAIDSAYNEGVSQVCSNFMEKVVSGGKQNFGGKASHLKNLWQSDLGPWNTLWYGGEAKTY